MKAKLEEWGVLEENFTYDLNGLGQTFKGFFRRSVPFNNREAVEDKYRYVYDNVKSQCAYLFAHKLIDGEISINPRLLKRKYSGKGFEKWELKQILMKERKCIRAKRGNVRQRILPHKEAGYEKVRRTFPRLYGVPFHADGIRDKKNGKASPERLLRYVNPLNYR